MVEHVMHAIAAVSDEVLVLHHGEVLTRARPRTVLADPRVVEAYLGARYAERAEAPDEGARCSNSRHRRRVRPGRRCCTTSRSRCRPAARSWR